MRRVVMLFVVVEESPDRFGTTLCSVASPPVKEAARPAPTDAAPMDGHQAFPLWTHFLPNPRSKED